MRHILEHVVLRLTVLICVGIAGGVQPWEDLLQGRLQLGRHPHVVHLDQVGLGGGAMGIG